MKNFRTKLKKEIISMEVVNTYSMIVQQNTQSTEVLKETIDQYCYKTEHKQIKPDETFSYKAFSLN